MKEVDSSPLKLGWFTLGLFGKRKYLLPNACCSKTHERYGTSSFQRICVVVLGLIWSNPSLFDRYMKVVAGSTDKNLFDSYMNNYL